MHNNFLYILRGFSKIKIIFMQNFMRMRRIIFNDYPIVYTFFSTYQIRLLVSYNGVVKSVDKYHNNMLYYLSYLRGSLPVAFKKAERSDVNLEPSAMNE